MGTDIRSPQLLYSLICDDVRQEVGGKMSFMGVFENIYAEQFPAVHIRLAIVNEWMGGAGEYDTAIRILAPNRSETIAETKSKFTLTGDIKRCRQISVILNLELKTAGTYWIDIQLDGEVVSSLPLQVIRVAKRDFH